MNKYKIYNHGCDDSTIDIFELNEKEVETLVKVFDKLNKNSSYQCMPVILIEDIENNKFLTERD